MTHIWYRLEAGTYGCTALQMLLLILFVRKSNIRTSSVRWVAAYMALLVINTGMVGVDMYYLRDLSQPYCNRPWTTIIHLIADIATPLSVNVNILISISRIKMVTHNLVHTLTICGLPYKKVLNTLRWTIRILTVLFTIALIPGSFIFEIRFYIFCMLPDWYVILSIFMMNLLFYTNIIGSIFTIWIGKKGFHESYANLPGDESAVNASIRSMWMIFKGNLGFGEAQYYCTSAYKLYVVQFLTTINAVVSICAYTPSAVATYTLKAGEDHPLLLTIWPLGYCVDNVFTSMCLLLLYGRYLYPQKVRSKITRRFPSGQSSLRMTSLGSMRTKAQPHPPNYPRTPRFVSTTSSNTPTGSTPGIVRVKSPPGVDALSTPGDSSYGRTSSGDTSQKTPYKDFTFRMLSSEDIVLTPQTPPKPFKPHTYPMETRSQQRKDTILFTLQQPNNPIHIDDLCSPPSRGPSDNEGNSPTYLHPERIPNFPRTRPVINRRDPLRISVPSPQAVTNRIRYC